MKKVDELSTKNRVTKQMNNLTRKQNYESKTVDVLMM